MVHKQKKNGVILMPEKEQTPLTIPEKLSKAHFDYELRTLYRNLDVPEKTKQYLLYCINACMTQDAEDKTYSFKPENWREWTLEILGWPPGLDLEPCHYFDPSNGHCRGVDGPCEYDPNEEFCFLETELNRIEQGEPSPGGTVMVRPEGGAYIYNGPKGGDPDVS